jgi:hypothetical protein
MKKLYYLALIYIAAILNIYGQGEYNNWYFGKFAGITFNTPNREPIPLYNNRLDQYEGCASISDLGGTLLFYTNGMNVLDRTGGVMNNSELLKGHQSSTSSAIIVKQPGSSSIYYIFTADAGEYLDPPNEGINYSIVDMDLNGGLGGMIAINIPLLKPATEKLTAAKHANGKDIWILTHGWKNNNFYAYLLTSQGITDTVITSIGFTPTQNNETIGYMKVSPKGNKVAVAILEKPFFEIYRFDNKSGVFFDRLQIAMDNYFTLYGLEFSPSGDFLYVGNSRNFVDNHTLFQFDLKDYDAGLIKKSEYIISYTNGHLGALQLAPNNKIYMSVVGRKALSSIDAPNKKCPACSSGGGASLGDSLSNLGLPQAIPNYSYSKSITICENKLLILDPDEFLYDTTHYKFDYEWKGPNGYTSKFPVPLIDSVALADSGEYTLTVNYEVNGEIVTIKFKNIVTIIPHNNFKLLGDTVFCDGKYTTLSADTSHADFRYLWSTKETSKTIKVTVSGIYKLYISTYYGCIDSAEIKINVIPVPKSEITGSKLICENMEVLLESLIKSDTLTYLWSTGSTETSIIINKVGWYWLVVKNKQGCFDSSAINVKKYDNLHLNIAGDNVICSNKPGYLSAEVVPYDSTLNYVYKWSNGLTDKYITITKPGKYSVTVTIENKCVLDAEIDVSKANSPVLVLNKSGKVSFCEGDSVEIYDLNENISNKYFWSDGVKGNKRTINQSGLYILTVINIEDCSDSDSVLVIVNTKPEVYIEDIIYQTGCGRDSALLITHPIGPEYKYKWSDGRETDSIIVKKSGLYIVSVTDSNGCSNISSVGVTLGSGMDIKTSGVRDFCSGDSIIVTANTSFMGSDNDFKYLWSTGETTKSIIIKNSGQYYINVTHKDGCKGSDTINVKVYDMPDVKLNYNGKISICSNDTITLKPETIIPEYRYFWIDGFNQMIRNISKSGIYSLVASNGNFCADTASVEVEVLDLPKVTINVNGKNAICQGETTELSASFTTGLKFNWSTGENTSKVNVNLPGIYTLYYSNILGCNDSTKIEIESSPEIVFNIITTNYSLCQGDSAILSTNNKFADYKWSNGEKTETITVHQAGTYFVNIIDSNGCIGNSSIEITDISSGSSFKIIDSTYLTECNLKISKKLEIQNISGHDILITDVISNLAESEIINKNDILGLIKTNEIKDVKILFNFKQPDSLSTLIKILAETPCNIEFDFPVSVKSNAKTLIWADTIKTQSGSDICIPIYYKLLCPEKLDSLQEATFSIEFISDYFYPETVSRGTIISKDINEAISTIIINVDKIDFNSNDSLLLLICGKALIGKKLPGIISIKDFKWDNKYILDSNKNGALITDACAIEIRGIRYYKPTTMSVNPNPAGENFNIDIITQSIGKHVIYIYDFRGDLFKNIEFNIDENSPLNHTFLLNSINFNQGIYNIILKSPWDILSIPLVIVR